MRRKYPSDKPSRPVGRPRGPGPPRIGSTDENFNFRISDDLRAAIEAIVERDHLPRAAVIRRLVHAGLKFETQQRAAETNAA